MTDMRLQQYGRLVCLALAMTTACAPESDEGESAELAETTSHLKFGPLALSSDKPTVLAEVALRDRRGAIRFVELEPGHLVELEYGDLSDGTVPSAEPENLSAAQRYAHHAGRPAPTALVAAQERANVKRGRPASYGLVTPATAATSDAQTKAGRQNPRLASGRDWFRNTYCVQTDRYEESLNMTGEYFIRIFTLGYLKAGIYNGHDSYGSFGDLNGYISYKHYPNYSFTASGVLYSGWYMALRDDSLWDATGDVTANGASWDYDVCLNYHF